MSRMPTARMSGGPGLSERANVALECVHQHRLLSTAQLHALIAPGVARRRVQRMLSALADDGLLTFVHQRGQAHRPMHLWHITATGADVVLASGTRAEPRRRVYTQAQAAGQLQHHTLAVNHVGLAFVAAARERGDDCGPLAWRHELAHPVGPRRSDTLIADAVLSYLTIQPARLEYRFVELDRATTPVDALATKLARYHQLAHHHAAGAAEPVWRRHYPVLPGVLVVLTGASRTRLERRAQTAAALHRSIAGAPAVSVSVCACSTTSSRTARSRRSSPRWTNPSAASTGSATTRRDDRDRRGGRWGGREARRGGSRVDRRACRRPLARRAPRHRGRSPGAAGRRHRRRPCAGSGARLGLRARPPARRGPPGRPARTAAL